MAILYKNAKKEVDKEFNELTKAGWKPVENEDGTTYSWKNDKGEIYKGKLNPTPGRDADAGFLKQHLTREARQDRLMSEKVTAMLAHKDKSIASGTGKGEASNTQPKTDETVVPAITRETAPAKTQLTSTRKIDIGASSGLTDQDKTLRKSSVQPKQKTLGESTIDFTPTDDELDTKNPYMYVDQGEYQKENSWVQRAGQNVWGGTNIGDITMLMHGNRPSPVFSGEMVSGKVPRTRVKDGKTQVLVHNPNFKFEPKAQENILGQPGSKFNTVMANTLTNIEGLVMPSKIRSIPSATKLAAETVAGALKEGPAASKTAQVIKVLFPKATEAINIIPKAGQAAIEGTSLIPKALKAAPMIPEGTEMAGNVFRAATQPKGFAFKAIKISPQSPLGPAFKCGGKMMPKKLTPKMKGK